MSPLIRVKSPEKVKPSWRDTSKILLQNKFSILEESSNQEGRNSPTKNEDSLICLYFKKRFNVNLDQLNISNFINFELICKNDLLDVINNYFYMQFCETLNKEMDFNFNPNNIWEYFNFEIIFKEEMQKFVYSVIKNWTGDGQ